MSERLLLCIINNNNNNISCVLSEAEFTRISIELNANLRLPKKNVNNYYQFLTRAGGIVVLDTRYGVTMTGLPIRSD